MPGEPLTVAREVASQLADTGAEAVVLVGSAAAGAAHSLSDVDLYAIGAGPATLYEVVSGRLVSSSWRTAETVRASFVTPAQIGEAVPAWKSAIILHDPGGAAKALQAEAHAFDWAPVSAACDAHVADDFHGYAEEVLKLVSALERRDAPRAAVQRNVIVLRMARIMSIHLRLLYRTENLLWERVAAALGPDWRKAQSAAFGLGGEDVTTSSMAALKLFRLAAEELRPLLDGRQSEVVDLALRAGRGFE